MLRAALIAVVGVLLGTAPAHAAGRIAYSDRDCSLWTPTAVPDPCPRVISVAAEDGSGATRITDGAAPGEPSYGGDTAPDWSPDGRSIAFTRVWYRRPPDDFYRGHVRFVAVWTMNADGSGQRQVLTAEESARFLSQSQPMWTADGTRIVFTGEVEGVPPRLYSVRPDGTDLRPITPEGAHVVHPSLTPDGGVTYMTESFGVPGSQAPHGLETTIWRADPGTGRRGPVFFGDVMASNGSVSPDGRWLALFTARADTYRIQTLGLDGSGLIDRADANRYGDLLWGGPSRLLLAGRSPTNGAQTGELWALGLGPGDEPQLVASGFSGGHIDWHPGSSQEPLTPPDELPPVVMTGPPAKPATAAAAAARVRRFARIPLIAADGSGILRVEAALARVAKAGCRHATPAGRLGPARSCQRPRWRVVDSVAAWRRMTDPLPRGRYALRVRARDTEGNRTRGGKVRRIVLRSAPR